MSVTTVEFTTTYVLITCGKCGLSFGVPGNWNEARRNEHDTFYCPNGHPRAYSGESRAEKLERELRAAKARATHAEDQRQAAERSASAVRGQMTKLKKRVGNGVCPCCNRSFANLNRHMSGQHPDFVPTA